MELLKNSTLPPYTQEQLVVLVQQNDEQAFNTLVDEFLPIIRAKAVMFKKLEADDLVQEGLLGLWSAVQTYDSNKSASFKTYANKCIDNRMFTGANKSRCKKYIPTELIISLDNKDFMQVAGGLSPEQRMIDRESYIGMIRHIKKILSQREFSVLGYYLAGYSYIQIAQKLGTTPKVVDNALQRIRKKLKHK